MIIKTKTIFTPIIIAFAIGVIWSPPASADPNEIIFPVLGSNNYSDTFLAYRAGQVDNKHHAIDIFANKHSYILSPIDGTIRYVGYPQDSWGWYMVIVDKDGFEYHFMHINNDNHGTDDGQASAMLAYAPDMLEGNPVKRGQHIAYVGDSGNAETTPAHLHFEIVYPEYTDRPYRDIPVEGFVNPFTFLNKAPRLTSASAYPEMATELLPFGPYDPGVNVAIGNFDADNDEEFVTGAGEKGGPHVKVYEKNKTFTGKEFFAYNPQHWTGTDVAAGDLDGDGVDEIITGAGPGGGPHVRAFRPDGTEVASFFAYDARFSGGVHVAAGDIDGDGKAEIITGARRGGGPHIRIFNTNGSVVSEGFAYNALFYGGVDVASGDFDMDGTDEIVTTPGQGGGPHVKIMKVNENKNIQTDSEFFAYSAGFYGGVRLSVSNIDTSSVADEIVTIPLSLGGPNVKLFNDKGNVLRSDFLYEEWWYGTNDIATGEGWGIGSTGVNRKATVRGLYAPLITQTRR